MSWIVSQSQSRFIFPLFSCPSIQHLTVHSDLASHLFLPCFFKSVYYLSNPPCLLFFSLVSHLELLNVNPHTLLRSSRCLCPCVFVLKVFKKTKCAIWKDISARWFLPPCSRLLVPASVSYHRAAIEKCARKVHGERGSGGPRWQFKHASSAVSILFVHLKRFFRSFTQDVSLLLFLILLYCFHFLPFNLHLHVYLHLLSLLLAELCILLACSSAVFGKDEDLFSSDVHFRDPQLSLFICHLPFLPQMIFRGKKREKHFLIISPLSSFHEDGVFLLFAAKQLLHI